MKPAKKIHNPRFTNDAADFSYSTEELAKMRKRSLQNNALKKLAPPALNWAVKEGKK